MTPPPKLDASQVRALAVAADCDPRTILRAFRGQPTRGSAGRRALRALIDAGIPFRGVSDPSSPAGQP